jgi:hypothetical protein
MPKNWTSVIILLVALAVLGLDTASASADRNHGLTHTSVPEPPSGIAN